MLTYKLKIHFYIFQQKFLIYFYFCLVNLNFLFEIFKFIFKGSRFSDSLIF